MTTATPNRPRRNDAADDVHKRVMSKFRMLSDDAKIQTLVNAGILTTDRQLAKQYRAPKPAKPSR